MSTTKTCTHCGTRFQDRSKAQSGKFCTPAHREAHYRAVRRGDPPKATSIPGDRTEELLDALATASEADLARFSRQIHPVALDHVGWDVLRLKAFYGPASDLSAVLKARGLPTTIILDRFIEEYG